MSVAVCIPSGGTWNADFGFCLGKLLLKAWRYPIPGVNELLITMIQSKGSMLSQNRERLWVRALEAGVTHVLFLDTDMVFPEDTISRLAKWRKPFVAAAGVVKRREEARVAARGVGKEEVVWRKGSKGLVEVAHVGLAVALIDLEIGMRMSAPRFKMEWVEEEGAYMGEDVWFCRKWREEVGERIWVDKGLSEWVRHMGTYPYGLREVWERG